MKLKHELLSYLLYLTVLLLFRGEGKQYRISLKLNAYYGISGKPSDAVYRSFIELSISTSQQIVQFTVSYKISDQWPADVLIVSNTVKKRCLRSLLNSVFSTGHGKCLFVFRRRAGLNNAAVNYNNIRPVNVNSNVQKFLYHIYWV